MLPAGFRNDSNDSRILACALNLAAERATAPSPWCPRTCRCGSRRRRSGLAADEYRAQDVISSGWTGMAELEVAKEQVDTLFASGLIDLDAARELPCHTGVKLVTPTGSALGRVTPGKQVRLVRGEKEAFGLRGRSAEQRIALDLLMDDEIGIVSLGGRAGTGKSALALCAGLELVMERRAHRKVVVFRPLYAVGGQDLGYLPGSEGEKMRRGRRPCSTRCRQSPRRR